MNDLIAKFYETDIDIFNLLVPNEKNALVFCRKNIRNIKHHFEQNGRDGIFICTSLHDQDTSDCHRFTCHYAMPTFNIRLKHWEYQCVIVFDAVCLCVSL